MKVCIASVHVKCERHRLWRELQWKFISENATWDYEYYVVANGLSPTLFKDATGVAHVKAKTSHSACLEEVRRIFEESDAEYCLLLDSDCWPIRKSWEELLSIWLVHGCEKRVYQYEYRLAAPVRTENLDVFPHPCAVFLEKEHLDMIEFGFGQNFNLLGKSVTDVGGAMGGDEMGFGGVEGCYPLLKTNYISPHPVYASIYGDIFYHHCAGSRGAGVRCADYYRHLITLPQQKKIYTKVTQQLKSRPKQFIDALRGVKSRVSNAAVKF